MLLIDDEVDSVKSATTLIEKKLSVEIIGVENPYQGLIALENDGFAGIITDLRMPEFDIEGIQILKITNILYPSLPKIILSAFCDEVPYINLLRAVKYDLVLNKPLPMLHSDRMDDKIEELNALIHKRTDEIITDVGAFRYIGRIKGAIVVVGNTMKEIIQNVKEMNIHRENIEISDQKKEPYLHVRKPLSFLKEL